MSFTPLPRNIGSNRGSSAGGNIESPDAHAAIRALPAELAPADVARALGTAAALDKNYAPEYIAAAVAAGARHPDADAAELAGLAAAAVRRAFGDGLDYNSHRLCFPSSRVIGFALRAACVERGARLARRALAAALWRLAREFGTALGDAADAAFMALGGLRPPSRDRRDWLARPSADEREWYDRGAWYPVDPDDHAIRDPPRAASEAEYFRRRRREAAACRRWRAAAYAAAAAVGRPAAARYAGCR